MSRRPGLGADFIRKYWQDIYSVHDCVMIGSKRAKIPAFFDKYMEVNHNDDYETSKQRRAEKVRPEENTRERLDTRELCQIMRKKFYSEINP